MLGEIFKTLKMGTSVSKTPNQTAVNTVSSQLDKEPSCNLHTIIYNLLKMPI